MRDYREAKIMAASLRKALRGMDIEVNHSQSLELVAKTLGLDNWNVLAAAIESAQRPRPAATSWSPGEAIVIRDVKQDGPYRGSVTHASAAIVVEDRPTQVVTFEPLGTDMRASRIDWATGVLDGPHPQKRHTTDRLTIVTPGASHAVSLLFHGGGGPFICWYVDLQEPFRRVPGGAVYCDQALDIVIGPDRQWRWKDEDHLARMIELGWIDAGRARALYKEGEAVIEAARRGSPPFDDRWVNWRPDPAWPIPELPDDWATIPEYD
ncbi:MAG: glyoxalase superfamily protein [Caulobacteraceae bacterium]